MVKDCMTRVSEQKDAPLESPLGVSEQKDVPLESPLGASEQKDASLESQLGASEQKDASLESQLGASEQKDASLESPTVVSLHQRPLKWFPTAANGWRSPLSAGRVGAYCIRPQTIRTRNSSVWLEGALICNCPCRGIGWGVCNTPLLLGTPSGHWPQKCFPTAAPSGHWLLKWFPTAAPSDHWPPKWFPTVASSGQQPLYFFSEKTVTNDAQVRLNE